MSDGTSKKISEVKPGDDILTFDPDSQIVEAMVVKNHQTDSFDILTITLEDRVLEVTHDHPIFIGNAKYRSAELLEIGDRIYVLSEDRQSLLEREITGIEDKDGNEAVYHLTSSGPFTFFANGVAVHNKTSGGGGDDGGGGNHCFTGETPVMIAGKREVEISMLGRQHEIVAFTDNHKIVHTRVREIIEHVASGYYRIETSRGVVNVTGNHPFYVGGGLFRKAFKLTPNDVIYQEDGETLSAAQIISKRFVRKPVTVFNLSVDGPQTYFASGIAVHNKAGGGGTGGGGGDTGGGGGGGGGGGCFTADTQIHMADGTIKSINSLNWGDQVMAFDSYENIVNGTVEKLLPHRAKDILKISFGDISLRVTKDHPFYLGDGRYQAAELLEQGDEILVYDASRDLFDVQNVDKIEHLTGGATVWNLTVRWPNTFFANGVAVHNKGGGGNDGNGGGGGGGGGGDGGSDDNHGSGGHHGGGGGPDSGDGGSNGGGGGSSSGGKHHKDSDSSDSSSSSCSSFSSDSSSSEGCPLLSGEYNLNCNEINLRALDAITIDLSRVTTTTTFCRPCKGCAANKGLLDSTDPPKGLLHIDTSGLTGVCLVRGCKDGTKYSAQVILPATAIACSFNCSRPQPISLPLDVTLTEEMGRWVLEVVLTDVDGTAITIFYGTHWDSAKIKTTHCSPPNDFRVCDKPEQYKAAPCPITCLQSYNEISAIVSHDGGRSWEKHHAIVRTAGFENLSTPIAIPDRRQNKIILIYQTAIQEGFHNEESDNHHVKQEATTGTFYLEVPTNLFRPEDAFKDYDRPQIIAAFDADDLNLKQYTQDGQKLRQQVSFLVGGKMPAHEEAISTARVKNGLIPRMINRNSTLDIQAGHYNGYVDRQGKTRLWHSSGARSTVPTPQNGDRDFCMEEGFSLVVSGITDKRCPCNTLMEMTTMHGVVQPDKVTKDKQGNDVHTPVKGFVKWVSDSKGKRKWTLQRGTNGWDLISRNNMIKLSKLSTNAKCPENGTYRLECGFCNGWVTATVAGVPDSAKETSDSVSSEQEAYTQDGKVSLFSSTDGGITWKGTSLEWTSGSLATVIYDDFQDITYVFYVTEMELMFMKVIPSGMLDSPDLQTYLNSDAGNVPIFLSGDISYLDKDQKRQYHNFKKRIKKVLPDDFVMDYKMAVLAQSPAASPTPHGSIRFYYIDVNGHIASGIWNGGLPQLMAKMQRRDGTEKPSSSSVDKS